MKFLIKLIIIAAISFALANVLGGVYVDSFWTALVFALILALLNVIAKPILIILTLPVTILTLGLFLFVINAVVVLLASNLVQGFRIDNFWWALLFSLLLSFIMSFIDKEEKKENESR